MPVSKTFLGRELLKLSHSVLQTGIAFKLLLRNKLYLLKVLLHNSFYGQVAKWLNAADCKSVLYEFGGSNPPLPI